nr:MAG TPA: hypothetical protein [Crassvirales sp.]
MHLNNTYWRYKSASIEPMHNHAWFISEEQ